MTRSALVLVIILFAGSAQAEPTQCRAIMRPTGTPANTCSDAKRLRIAAVGDVLLHRPLQRRGFRDIAGFRSLWREAEPVFAAADIAFANLEGPIAPGLNRSARQVTDPGLVFDDKVYTSFPLFNYHPSVARDLRISGIDIVSTANNHALDRRSAGVDLTIEQLRLAGLAYTGTIKAGAPRNFVHYMPTRLGRLAWIACSYSTNGLPDPKHQVLLCDDSSDELLRLIRQEARNTAVAAVIVAPHWGNEYRHSPSAYQRDLAQAMVDAGAIAIIGTHPHVVQPWEWIDAGRNQRSLVIYSTGNFVSGQSGLSRRVGALAWIELCAIAPDRNLRIETGPKVRVARVGWIPVLMMRTGSGPSIRMVRTNASGVDREAMQLLTRHLPPSGVDYQLSCNSQSGSLLKLQ